MCGRFTLRTPLGAVVAHFLAEPAPLLQLGLRYNIAPTQSVPVVRMHDGRRELTGLQWGLIPSWAKDTKIACNTLNARSETAAEKPAFRTAFRKRRCLVVADGYYEWLRVGKSKQPYLYEVGGGQPFAFAGLWESWWGPDGAAAAPLETCTILTTSANRLASQVHDRMPVIIEPGDYAAWLDPANQDPASLRYLLAPYPDEAMSARPVSTFVNNARNEGPQCIENSL